MVKKMLSKNSDIIDSRRAGGYDATSMVVGFVDFFIYLYLEKCSVCILRLKVYVCIYLSMCVCLSACILLQNLF